MTAHALSALQKSTASLINSKAVAMELIMSYALQIRCWYCRDILPLEVTPNTNSDQLIVLTLACPEYKNLAI